MEILPRSLLGDCTPTVRNAYSRASADNASIGAPALTMPGGWMQFLMTWRNLTWPDADRVESFLLKQGGDVFLLPVGPLNKPGTPWSLLPFSDTRVESVDRSADFVQLQGKIEKDIGDAAIAKFVAGATMSDERALAAWAAALDGCLIQADAKVHKAVEPPIFAGASVSGTDVLVNVRFRMRPVFHQDTGSYPDFGEEGVLEASIHNPVARVVRHSEMNGLERKSFSYVPSFTADFREAIY